jgi:hypothetical protein
VWWRRPLSLLNALENLFSENLISEGMGFGEGACPFPNVFGCKIRLPSFDGGASRKRRVLRGGSFNNNEANARCAFRNENNIDNFNNNGFRVAASISLYFVDKSQKFWDLPAPEMLYVYGRKPRQNRRESAAESWLDVSLRGLG